MSSRTWTVFAMIALITTASTAFLMSDDSDAATEKITISGMVCEVGSTEATPLSGVLVTLTDITTKDSKQAHTDSAGNFEITIDKPALMFLNIKCYKEGYGVLTLPACITSIGESSDEGLLNLNEFPPSSTYTISEDKAHSILMSSANVSVTIKATGSNDRLLKGANITLFQGGNVKYSGETNDKGECIVDKELPVGSYTVKINCEGYENFEDTISISKTDYDFTLHMQEKEIATYGGLTSYNIMMITGVAMGLALVIASYLLCRRNWAKVDDLDD